MLSKFKPIFYLFGLLLYLICSKSLFVNKDWFVQNSYILAFLGTLYTLVIFSVGTYNNKRYYQILASSENNDILNFINIVISAYLLMFYTVITVDILKEFSGDFISKIWMQYIYPMFF